MKQKPLFERLKKVYNIAIDENMKLTKRNIQPLAGIIADELATAGDLAVHMIMGELTEVYRLNYDYCIGDIQTQAGVNISFSQYDRNQLLTFVKKGQSPFTQLAYKRLGSRKRVVKKLQNQLMIAVIKGESQAKVIKRIRSITGQSYRQAKRVAQTERNRVASQGREMGIHEANMLGVSTSKQWVARLRNTRDRHVQTHLEIVPDNEVFSNGLMYPGDPSGDAANTVNCFCLIVPVVTSISPALQRARERYNATVHRP